MYYVYLLGSIPNPNQTYIGPTGDLRKRLWGTLRGKIPPHKQIQTLEFGCVYRAS
jgi:hypothetical protein